MLISQKYRSPHLEKKPIPVQFAVLHYTAQSLKGSLNIFLSHSHPVSCHILIDEKGALYEIVPCTKGLCQKAFHAGHSRFLDSEALWENFNRFSLGIELVNWNGNVFPFSENQYASLFALLSQLKKLYPALEKPERILGHEHIAGFRGKADPGYLFDWPRLFKTVYPGQKAPQRTPRISSKKAQALQFLNQPSQWNDKKAKRISLLLEKPFLPFELKKMLFYALIKM